MTTVARRISYQRVKLQLVREKTEPYHAPRKIRSARDVAELARSVIGDEPREHFLGIYLDGRLIVAAVHVISIGTTNNATVHPREVFTPAVSISASAIVVVHNHPSGDPTPSPEDRAVTERLRKAGELLGVEVLDHVVLGADRFFSFADESYHAVVGV